MDFDCYFLCLQKNVSFQKRLDHAVEANQTSTTTLRPKLVNNSFMEDVKETRTTSSQLKNVKQLAKNKKFIWFYFMFLQVASQAWMVPKRLSLPRHPLNLNTSQVSVLGLKKYLSNFKLHPPLSFGRLHLSGRF